MTDQSKNASGLGAELTDRIAGLEPEAAVAEVRLVAQHLRKEKARSGKRLSRAWFDVIVLLVIATPIVVVAAVRYWPIGCSSEQLLQQAEKGLQEKTGAAAVSLHLVEKVERTSDRLRCRAYARIEHADRSPDHRYVDYVAKLDRGRLVEVGTELEAPDQ